MFFFNNFFTVILDLLLKIKLINGFIQLRTDVSSLPEIKKKMGILPFTYVKTGFFQTEKLFDPNQIAIKLKKPYIQKAKAIMKNLPIGEKVFIHIRRGDYLIESFMGKRGIDLPKSYYIQAISLIEKEVKEPFYVFLTDDPEFVECCFKDIKNKYVSTECLAIDLSLMTLCQYGISSNSSFSWWGAFLAEKKEIIIFPNYWYGWKQRIHSHVDIQPTWGVTIDPVKTS
jgi:hypothetical protein